MTIELRPLDSYETINNVWAIAYDLIGDYDRIKIVMSGDTYEVHDRITNQIIGRGIIA
jgi:hypothetical protein